MKQRGFTIPELLITITIIGILAALVVVAYSGIHARAVEARRKDDTAQLKKAIMTARLNKDKVLKDITGSTWTGQGCDYYEGGDNTGNIEPKNLPKTHTCWTMYYAALDAISAASGSNLNNLKKGDYNGNPYFIDENEEDLIKRPGQPCVDDDQIVSFKGEGAALDWDKYVGIPFFRCPNDPTI